MAQRVCEPGMGGGRTAAYQIGHHVDSILIKYLEGLVQRGHVIRLNITLDAALKKERRETKLKASRMVMRQLQQSRLEVMVVKTRVVIEEVKCDLT